MSGLDGVVVGLGVSIKIFFHGEEAADVVAFGVERDDGKGAGGPTVAFDEGMDGD